MTTIYRYRLNQYIGPVADQYIYDAPFLLSGGRSVEPTNVQWITDPSQSCSPDQQRLLIRRGQKPQIPERTPPVQYRPFL